MRNNECVLVDTLEGRNGGMSMNIMHFILDFILIFQKRQRSVKQIRTILWMRFL